VAVRGTSTDCIPAAAAASQLHESGKAGIGFQISADSHGRLPHESIHVRLHALLEFVGPVSAWFLFAVVLWSCYRRRSAFSWRLACADL